MVLLLPAVRQRSLPPKLLPAVEALARMRHRILLLHSEKGSQKAINRRSTRKKAKGNDEEEEEGEAGMPPSWITIMAACCIEVRKLAGLLLWGFGTLTDIFLLNFFPLISC